MVLIPTRWLKLIFWPLWPVALVYWLRASRRGTEPDWGIFDFWVGRAWWAMIGIAVMVGAISAVVR
jgi:hypothetical protein